MKLHDDAETDSLYIEFNERLGADSREVADGVVLDLDEAGKLAGIDIQQASKLMDLTRLDAGALPLAATRAH